MAQQQPGTSTTVEELAVPEIRLLGYPVRLGQRQQEHNDDLLRELSLLVISRSLPGQELHAPLRLLDMSDMLVTMYRAELEPARKEREAAFLRGERTVDLVYRNVLNGDKIVRDYAAIAAQVDRFCASGDLLTLTTPPDLLELRRWTLEQFLDQMAGRPPARWHGPLV